MLLLSRHVGSNEGEQHGGVGAKKHGGVISMYCQLFVFGVLGQGCLIVLITEICTIQNVPLSNVYLVPMVG